MGGGVKGELEASGEVGVGCARGIAEIGRGIGGGG